MIANQVNQIGNQVRQMRIDLAISPNSKSSSTK